MSALLAKFWIFLGMVALNSKVCLWPLKKENIVLMSSSKPMSKDTLHQTLNEVAEKLKTQAKKELHKRELACTIITEQN